VAPQTGFEVMIVWLTATPNWRCLLHIRHPFFWYGEYPFAGCIDDDAGTRAATRPEDSFCELADVTLRERALRAVAS